MNCKNKRIFIRGFKWLNKTALRGEAVEFECFVTNDSVGKTLSIYDGEIQFTIPFEPLEEYLK